MLEHGNRHTVHQVFVSLLEVGRLPKFYRDNAWGAAFVRRFIVGTLCPDGIADMAASVFHLSIVTHNHKKLSKMEFGENKARRTRRHGIGCPFDLTSREIKVLLASSNPALGASKGFNKKLFVNP